MSAAAAECDDLSIVDRVVQAEEVFVGRVLSFVERVEGSRVSRDCRALVERTWKGSASDTILLIGSPEHVELFASVRVGESLLVFGTHAGEGTVRAVPCLGVRRVDVDDPELAMLEYVCGAGAMIFAGEGGGVFAGGEPGPSFGVSIERGLVSRLLLRLRVTQGPYRIEPITDATGDDITGHAISVGLALRGRAYLSPPGVMPYVSCGVVRAFPVDGLASSASLDHGLWSVHAGAGIEVPLGAQFGAYAEVDVAHALDGRAPRAYGLRAGVQVALTRIAGDPPLQ